MARLATEVFVETANDFGLFAERPVASSVQEGFVFYATDANGGTPYQVRSGAWVQAAAGVLETGGRELDFAKIEANFVQVNGANGEYDIPGLAINPTVAAHPVCIEAYAKLVTHTVANTIVVLKLFEDGTEVEAATHHLPTANNGRAVHVATRRAPSAGVHAYKARLFINTAGTVTLYAAANGPAWLSAVER